MNIYDNVKRLAVERGYSIHRLEKDAGIGNGSVAKWRDGANIKSLVAVAKVLEVTVDDLIKEG